MPFDAPWADPDAELPSAFFFACPGGTAAGESVCADEAVVAGLAAPCAVGVSAAGCRPVLSVPAAAAAVVPALFASLEPVAGGGDATDDTFVCPPAGVGRLCTVPPDCSPAGTVAETP